MRHRVVVGRPFSLTAKAVDSSAIDARRGSRKSSHRSVTAGRAWDLDVRLAASHAAVIDARTRALLVKVVAGVGVLFLLSAAALSLAQQSYGLIAAVWAILGPIYGGMAVYFFAPRSAEK